MSTSNCKFTINAENWHGNHWIEIDIIDGSIEVVTSSDKEFDMPYVESADQWGDALSVRVGQLISQFLYELKTATKNR